MLELIIVGTRNAKEARTTDRRNRRNIDVFMFDVDSDNFINLILGSNTQIKQTVKSHMITEVLCPNVKAIYAILTSILYYF